MIYHQWPLKYEKRHRELTPTLEIVRNCPSTPFNFLNELVKTIGSNDGSDLGRDVGAYTLNMGNSNTLAAVCRWVLPIEHWPARVTSEFPLLFALGGAHVCARQVNIPPDAY